ncbi:interleukin-like EMT inducer domain-containing protein [Paenibacillus sepulcri]|uniref:GP-PDE domain-containing protein n=1 Tax=Paenibacillus sepulcri TaxID=359917 RepID=A0ABS7BVV1_9BACL|nr:hypothetical protein [Paenibacillus sepulcri]
MLYKLDDLALLNKGSIYVPFSGIQAENRLSQIEKNIHIAYSALIHRQHGIWMKLFSNIDLDKNDACIYFHASSYIPNLRKHGYRVDAISGLYLLDFLKNVEEDAFVVISVKDEGSQQMTGTVTEELRKLGITSWDASNLRQSFIWAARKKDSFTYEVLHEECSAGDLNWESFFEDTPVSVMSGGALSSNLSSIRLNDQEWSINERGFNIVVYHSSSGIEAINFDTFTTLHAQGSLFKAQPSIEKTASNIFVAVSHAGGRIDGVNYTNCKEALEQSYSMRGHRVFEIDLELTSDGELVARHDWNSLLYQVLRQQPPEDMKEGEPLSLNQFTSLKILNQYTPLTIADIFQFLTDHPDAYVITDSKYTNPEIVEKQFIRLVNAAASYGYGLLLRVIPQLYTEEMYSICEKIFPFPQYVYTLYQTLASDEEIITFLLEKNIRFVTMSQERFKPSFVSKLKKLGSSVLIHTINDLSAVSEYVRMNVDGFYTDNLTASEIDKEVFSYRIELDTRRQVLAEFLKDKYKIPEEESRKRLDLVDAENLTKVTERLFQSQTVDDVHDIWHTYG